MSDVAGAVGKSGRRKRRSWTIAEKRRIVDESLEDGASIAEIARFHDLNANQLFTWWRQFGLEAATASEVTTLLPVTITPEREVEAESGGVGVWWCGVDLSGADGVHARGDRLE